MIWANTTIPVGAAIPGGFSEEHIRINAFTVASLEEYRYHGGGTLVTFVGGKTIWVQDDIAWLRHEIDRQVGVRG